MNRRNETAFRVAIALGFLLIAAIGAYHILHRCDLGMTLKEMDGAAAVAALSPDGAAAAAGMQVNDRLLRIASEDITTVEQAHWQTEGLLNDVPVTVELQRSGAESAVILTPQPTHHPLFLVLNLLLGLTFLTVGLIVRWGGRSDSTTRSFFRLCSVTGVAILLFSHENILQPLLLHHLYSFAWLAAYGMIPVTLVIFLIRLTGFSLRRRLELALYGVTGILIALLVSLYSTAYQTMSALWISRFEWFFWDFFGTALIIAFIAGLVLILRKYLQSSERAERDRMRWLLIVTGAGLLPFFLLYKLPIVFGGEELIPLWGVFGIMLIVPVGWGMAVASFRMLNLEWAFSRTIIYTLAVILTVYLILTLVFVVGYPLHLFKGISLAALVGGGALLLALGSAGLASPIRILVDNLYYRDWFNLQDMMKALGEQLTRASGELEIQRILTEELPSILSLEKVTLLVGSAENFRVLPPPKDDPRIASMLTDASVRLFQSGRYDLTTPPLPTCAARLASMGYQKFVPLVQGEVLFGVLLIGRKESKAPFGVRDHMLLDAITAPAATALANFALTRRLLEQEKRALAADMAGGIAHEINNALSPMLGQAQLMEFQLARDNSIPSDSLAPALGIIVTMCDRIRRIALNLNQLSQPPRLEREYFTLESVAAEAILILTETAGRIKRFSETDAESPYKLIREFGVEERLLFADRQQLGQLFMNLIVNSADALEERGYGTIAVGARAVESGGAIGYVADDGPGIPLEIQGRIFQPYFTTKAKGKGTGLGLAIIRQIAESHGGWVKCDSTVGVGARFEFFIPEKGD